MNNPAPRFGLVCNNYGWSQKKGETDILLRTSCGRGLCQTFVRLDLEACESGFSKSRLQPQPHF